MSSQPNVKLDVFTIVNNRIIEQLEKGCVPWRQPWVSAGFPRNLITSRRYRGINLLALSCLGYTSNLFLTLKQINELGGSVKKGEHAAPVVFWSQKEEQKKGSEEKEIRRVLRYYSVFNVEQCIGIPENRIPVYREYENDPIIECELVVENMPLKPKIQHKGHQAFYTPATDIVTMPKIKSFINSESYYITLFHELVHATGHPHRLNRESVAEAQPFGSPTYSEEELIAQVGACFLASHTGCSMKHFENEVAYISEWLKKLKNDKRLLLFASAKAQRAVDFILHNNEIETPEIEEAGQHIAP